MSDHDLKPEEILDSLRRVRRRLRAMLVIDGLSRLAVAVLATFAGFVLLDWWVHFPPLFRAGVLASLAIWSVVWIVRRIGRPALSPISLDQMALKLGRLTPDFRDRLASAAAFLLRGADGSPELWQRVLANTAKSAAETPLVSALSTRRPGKSTAAAMGLVVVLVGAGFAAPRGLETGLRRFVSPFSDAEWPKQVEIEPVTGASVAAFGESLQIEMRLRRGGDERLRGFVTWSQGGGLPRRDMMRRDADGVYRLMLEDLRADVRYTLEAGDDSTSDHPSLIRVVRRPAVKSARFVFSPPEYARMREQVVNPLDDGIASTVRGSLARLELIASKPLATRRDGGPAAELLFDGGQSIEFNREGDDLLVAEFPADKTANFEVRLVDRHGFGSRRGPAYRLDVRADVPPTARITRPSGVVEATPKAVIDVGVSASDDFGLTSLVWLATAQSTEALERTDLTEREGFKSDGLAAHVSFRWDLASLNLSPGDLLKAHAEVRDNFQLDGDTHGPIQSNKLHIRVISPDQLMQSAERDLLALRGLLHDMLVAVESVLDTTETVADGPARGRRLDRDELATLQRLADELKRTSVDGRHVSRRMIEVARRVERNRADRPDVARQARRLANAIRRIAADTLGGASESLMQAGESPESTQQHSDLMDSAEDQRGAIDALRSMIREIDQWSDFEDAARKVRELLDRQEALGRDIDHLARSIEGRPLDKLHTLERTELARAGTGQSLLARETDELLERMAALASELAGTEKPASESLKRARDVGVQRGAIRHMSEAAEFIRSNRVNRARGSQAESASSLRAMLAALDDKPRRALADLSRRVADVIARLERIVAVQRELLEKTQAIGDGSRSVEALVGLAGRQETLGRTTRTLAADIEPRQDEGIAAKAELHEAARRMAEVVEPLESGRSVDAEAGQQEALGLLVSALDRLQQLQAQTERLLGEYSMAAIREELDAIRQAQVKLREESAEIEMRRRDDDRLSRIDGLRLNRMADQQRKLTEPLETVKQRMLRSVVYQFVCDKIAAGMLAAADSLADHRCDAANAEQDRVIIGLNRLLEALAQEPPPDQAEYAEGGGGGSSGPTQAKPIPTLAELKVLRMMQVDVNERTVVIHQRQPDPILRSEEQLKGTEMIGESQREIHGLAVKMLQMAAGAGGGQ